MTKCQCLGRVVQQDSLAQRYQNRKVSGSNPKNPIVLETQHLRGTPSDLGVE